MDCPKCGHQQADTIQCAACGIYFDKYQRQQSVASVARRDTRESGFGLGALVLVAVLAAAVVYAFMRERKSAPDAPITTHTVGPTDPAAARDDFGSPGLKDQRTQAGPVNNGLETARNATVLIRHLLW